MSNFLQPIIDILDSVLSLIHATIGDWCLSLILFTLLIRFLLFPLNLKIAKQQALQVLIQPEMKVLREKYKGNQTKLAEETMKLYREMNVKPFAMFGPALIQMPIFMAMYSLFKTHGSEMSSFLISWVHTFDQVDAHHILPIISVGLSFITNMIPLTSNSLVTGRMQQLFVSLIIACVFLDILWKAPVALALYWIAGSVFALLERGLYRTPFGKKIIKKR